MKYKLLTPGPLSTLDSVKKAMLYDSCTWDNDYKEKTQDIRNKLLDIAQVDSDYTSILMQGSGTFGVEALIGSIIKNGDNLLVLINGAYGQRIYDIAKRLNKNVSYIKAEETSIFNKNEVEYFLKENDITHLMMVHCETTTGILNNINEIGELALNFNLKFMVDAMSSFGGIDINFNKLNIAALVSSANKCLEGVPGFSFIIIKKDIIAECKNNSQSLSLDLYDQWKSFEEESGKWRFTSPTHVVNAFHKALEEFDNEGGLKNRTIRYNSNQVMLVNNMQELGFTCCIKKEYQSPIITTFNYLDNAGFSFEGLYNYLKNNGFIIYPGKLSNLSVFRIGNIGQIYNDDIEALVSVIEKYVKEL